MTGIQKSCNAIALVACCSAWWFACQLSLLSTTGSDSACYLAGSGDCGATLKGEYSTLIGVSVAKLGVSFYAILFALCVIQCMRGRSRWSYPFFLLFVFAGFGASLWFVGLMIVFGLTCPYCAAVHACQALMTLAATLSILWGPSAIDRLETGSWHESSTARRVTRNKQLICGALIVAAVFIGMKILHYPSPHFSGKPISTAARSALDNKAHAEESLIELSSTGSQTVEFFVDYRCPQCAQLSHMLDQMMRDNPGQVRVKVRLFPLDANCNPAVAMTSTSSQDNCRLARLGYRVSQIAPGIYFSFHFQIAEHDGEIDYIRAKAIAESVVGRTISEEELASPEIARSLSRDIDLGIDFGIEALPTLICNGQRFEGRPGQQSALMAFFETQSTP